MREHFDPHDPEIEAIMHARAQAYADVKRRSLPTPVTDRATMRAIYRAADPTSELDGPCPIDPRSWDPEAWARVCEQMGKAVDAAVQRYAEAFRLLGETFANAFATLGEAIAAYDRLGPDGSMPSGRRRHRLDGRLCARHGEPLRAGQCRRCQRQVALRTG